MPKPLIVFGITGLIIVAGLAVGLGLYFGLKATKPATTVRAYGRGVNRNYSGGVASHGAECPTIGSEILKKKGSAVDAMIATMLCEGIAMPQNMGVGGGFLMTIYTRETKTAVILNAKEMAPLAATEDMFDGNASLSVRGGLAIGVPGELRGHWYAHQRYGKLPWREILQPNIDLCKRGHLVTPFLAKLFMKMSRRIRNDPGLREVFINPKTNKPYELGQYVKRKRLAATLEILAREGVDALYNGILTKPLIDDIQKVNGIITADDMKIYRPVWAKPIIAKLPNHQTLYTMPLPGSGAILTFILNILNGFLDLANIHTVTNWQRIVESFKYGYGKRTELGDPWFVDGLESLVANIISPSFAVNIRKNISDTKTYNDPTHYGARVSPVEDHGTAQLSVLAPNGDAVSVTSTINLYFGAGVRSPNTGIILNGQMDDFSSPNITNAFGVPPSPSNYIRPGKRPLSSTCPSIISDKNGDVVLVIGSAGGTKIVTVNTVVLMRYLWFGESLKTAVPKNRLHHQLLPMEIKFEHGFDQDIVRGLSAIGHKTNVVSESESLGYGFGALNAIGKLNGNVEGDCDHRKGPLEERRSQPQPLCSGDATISMVGESLKTAVPGSRLHHQLFPMEIKFEHDFNQNIVKGLSTIGHKTNVLRASGSEGYGFAALNASGKRNGVVEGRRNTRRWKKYFQKVVEAQNAQVNKKKVPFLEQTQGQVTEAETQAKGRKNN